MPTTIEIPDALVEDIRNNSAARGAIAAERVLADLVKLLPEPNPLDALDPDEGWKITGPFSACNIIQGTAIRVFVTNGKVTGPAVEIWSDLNTEGRAIPQDVLIRCHNIEQAIIAGSDIATSIKEAQ